MSSILATADHTTSLKKTVTGHRMLSTGTSRKQLV